MTTFPMLNDAQSFIYAYVNNSTVKRKRPYKDQSVNKWRVAEKKSYPSVQDKR